MRLCVQLLGFSLTIIIFWKKKKKRLCFASLKCAHNPAGNVETSVSLLLWWASVFRFVSSDLDEVLSGEYLGHPGTQWDLFI